MRRLHLATDLPVRKPCSEPFSAMPPVPGGRHCGRCDHVVHDLSAMTCTAASRFVAAHAGKIPCVRYLVRRDGSIVFAPEPARAPLPAIVAVTLAACTPWGPTMQPETDIPDDIEAVYDDPRPVIPPEQRGDRARDDIPCDPDGPVVEPPADATSAVRYPRRPVPHPVHEPKPRAPDPEERHYYEIEGGPG